MCRFIGIAASLTALALLCHAQTRPPYGPAYAQALRLAKAGSPQAREMLEDERLKKGTAYAATMGEFLFAVDSETAPSLFVDDEPGPKMSKAKAGFWYGTAKVETGRTHNFH